MNKNGKSLMSVKYSKVIIITALSVALLSGVSVDYNIRKLESLKTESSDDYTITVDWNNTPADTEIDGEGDINSGIKPPIGWQPGPEKPGRPDRPQFALNTYARVNTESIENMLPGDVRVVNFSSHVIFDDVFASAEVAETITLVGDAAHNYRIEGYELTHLERDDGVPVAVYSKTYTAQTQSSAVSTHKLNLKLLEHDTHQGAEIQIYYRVSSRYHI